MRSAEVKKKNIRALVLALCGLILTAILMEMPIMEFSTTLYTKKSANTFVGDEKYLEVRAEVEAMATRYTESGMTVSLDEDVTERTNSKGVKTSMVAFTIREAGQKNAFSFLGTGLVPGYVMAAILGCAALAVVLCLCGLAGTLDLDHAELPKGRKRLRTAACALMLVAIVLVPVFAMTTNIALSRSITLMAAGNEVAGGEALLAALDGFLYGGTAGENALSLLTGLSFTLRPALFIMMLSMAIVLLNMVILESGSIVKTLQRGALYLFVIVLIGVFLYPYYVMLITAFRSNAETTDMYFLHMLPTTWVWSNLRDVLARGVLKYLSNSILLSVGATAIAMLCGIPAAYAMSRMRFKGKNAFLGFVIMSQMFSPVVLLVGISQLMNTLHLNDSIIGLMLINAAFNQAFAIWLLYGTFSSISPEMEQAACIDGCNTVTAMLNILLPMAAPGIVTTLIFIFINAWNEYTISTVLISTNANKPITVGITQFSSFNMIEWQYLFAAALLATVPVVILFMCIEKHLASGLTSGGVKG